MNDTQLPKLKKGEINAGIVFVSGKPRYWLILLPGEKKALAWENARAWAKTKGGDLPTRKEQALLFANAAAAFERTWYWSGEQTASAAAYAWCTGFSNGTQLYWHKGYQLRARAVRRVPIR